MSKALNAPLLRRPSDASFERRGALIGRIGRLVVALSAVALTLFVFSDAHLRYRTISTQRKSKRITYFQAHSANDLRTWRTLLLKGTRSFKIDPYWDPIGEKFKLTHNAPYVGVEYFDSNDVFVWLAGAILSGEIGPKWYSSFGPIVIQLCFKNALPNLTTCDDRWTKAVDRLYEIGRFFPSTFVEFVLDGGGKPVGCMKQRWRPWASTWIVGESPLNALYDDDFKKGYDRYRYLDNPENLAQWELFKSLGYGKFGKSSYFGKSYPRTVWEPSSLNEIRRYVDNFADVSIPRLDFALNVDPATWAVFASTEEGASNAMLTTSDACPHALGTGETVVVSGKNRLSVYSVDDSKKHELKSGSSAAVVSVFSLGSRRRRRVRVVSENGSFDDFSVEDGLKMNSDEFYRESSKWKLIAAIENARVWKTSTCELLFDSSNKTECLNESQKVVSVSLASVGGRRRRDYVVGHSNGTDVFLVRPGSSGVRVGFGSFVSLGSNGDQLAMIVEGAPCVSSEYINKRADRKVCETDAARDAVGKGVQRYVVGSAREFFRRRTTTSGEYFSPCVRDAFTQRPRLLVGTLDLGMCPSVALVEGKRAGEYSLVSAHRAEVGMDTTCVRPRFTQLNDITVNRLPLRGAERRRPPRLFWSDP